MTTFQPGDVVRLTGEEWDLYPGHPRTGSTHTIDFINEEGEPGFHWNEEEWLIYLGYEAELAEGPLSPQAVLDAILEHQYAIDEWRAVPVKNADEDVVWLTARKADGHWQVKSVGGRE